MDSESNGQSIIRKNCMPKVRYGWVYLIEFALPMHLATLIRKQMFDVV